MSNSFLKMGGAVKLASALDQSIPTERTPLLPQQDDPIIIGGPGGVIKHVDQEEGDLENGSQHEIVEDERSNVTLVRVLSVLMVGSCTTLPLPLCQIFTKSNPGIFVANVDSSILMATYPVIASEFNDLKNATWLVTSFALAGAATQTLVSRGCGM